MEKKKTIQKKVLVLGFLKRQTDPPQSFDVLVTFINNLTMEDDAGLFWSADHQFLEKTIIGS